MGYSAQVVRKVREMFEKKRKDAENLSNQHRAEVYSACPEIMEIEKALSMTGLAVFKASMQGTEGLEQRIEAIKSGM